MRTINISAGYANPEETEADRWEQLKEQCGGNEEIQKAIGYLSVWNWDGYSHVDIVLMGKKGEMEMIATYRHEKGGEMGYTIGAVWHNDHFGFHS